MTKNRKIVVVFLEIVIGLSVVIGYSLYSIEREKDTGKQAIMMKQILNLSQEGKKILSEKELRGNVSILFCDGKKALLLKEKQVYEDTVDIEVLMYNFKKKTIEKKQDIKRVNSIENVSYDKNYIFLIGICKNGDGLFKRWKMQISWDIGKSRTVFLDNNLIGTPSMSVNVKKALFVLHTLNKTHISKTMVTRIIDNKHKEISSQRFLDLQKKGTVIEGIWNDSSSIYLYESDEKNNAIVNAYDTEGKWIKTYDININDFLVSPQDNIGYDAISNIIEHSGYIFFETYNHRVCVVKKKENCFQKLQNSVLISELEKGATLVSGCGDSRYVFLKKYMSNVLIVFDSVTEKFHQIRLKAEEDIKNIYCTQNTLYFKTVYNNNSAIWYEYSYVK